MVKVLYGNYTRGVEGNICAMYKTYLLRDIYQ